LFGISISIAPIGFNPPNQFTQFSKGSKLLS